MQTMRYINLLDRASNVRTSKCFIYNNAIIFAVSKNKISKAIGHGASHIRDLQEKLGKKVRIINEPRGLEDAEKFIREIVSPAKFKSLDIKDNVLVVTAGSVQNKAALLGRNKKKLAELRNILLGTFDLDLKVV